MVSLIFFLLFFFEIQLMYLHIYSLMYLYIDIEKLYMSPVTYVLLVTPSDKGVPDKKRR